MLGIEGRAFFYEREVFVCGEATTNHEHITFHSLFTGSNVTYLSMK